MGDGALPGSAGVSVAQDPLRGLGEVKGLSQGQGPSKGAWDASLIHALSDRTRPDRCSIFNSPGKWSKFVSA